MHILSIKNINFTRYSALTVEWGGLQCPKRIWWSESYTTVECGTFIIHITMCLLNMKYTKYWRKTKYFCYTTPPLLRSQVYFLQSNISPSDDDDDEGMLISTKKRGPFGLELKCNQDTCFRYCSSFKILVRQYTHLLRIPLSLGVI